MYAHIHAQWSSYHVHKMETAKGRTGFEKKRAYSTQDTQRIKMLSATFSGVRVSVDKMSSHEHIYSQSDVRCYLIEHFLHDQLLLHVLPIQRMRRHITFTDAT